MPPRLNRLPAAWVFVLTGILFNVLSAVIMHYFIGLNNDRINTVEREINDKELLIQSFWLLKTEVDRKQEFFLLLFTRNAEPPEQVDAYFRDYIKNLVATHHIEGFDTGSLQLAGNEKLTHLLDISHAAQAAIIKSINDTYVEILSLQDAKIPLERANSRLLSIAIFLQVTGLILVLARDLRRH